MMKSKIKTFGFNKVSLSGHFDASGSSAPSGLKAPGVASAARSGTGVYVLTLLEDVTGTDVVFASASTSIIGTAAKVTAYDLTAGTVTVTTVGEDFAVADTTGIVYFYLELQGGVDI